MGCHCEWIPISEGGELDFLVCNTIPPHFLISDESYKNTLSCLMTQTFERCLITTRQEHSGTKNIQFLTVFKDTL